jgi:esterase/lipase
VIDQPALVIQARDDPTAPLRNLKILASELPNVHKTVELTRSRHVITVDHDKELVAEELVAFAKAVLA